MIEFDSNEYKIEKDFVQLDENQINLRSVARTH